MKELYQHEKLSSKQQIEVQEKKQQQIELHYDSSVKPMKGHKTWEINIETREVNEALITKEATLQFSEDMNAYVTNPKIEKKKGFVYISALNQKSALKRYDKRKGSASLPIESRPIGFTL
jgi:hypothetical protein